MDKCEHYVDCDDENLLLDDESALEKKCVRCRKQIPVWVNGDTVPNWTQNINGVFLNEGSETIMSVIDELTDNLEDSPLLINDCYREPVNTEFHCHDSVGYIEDVIAWRKLMSASILCFIFMAAELLGGYFAGSLAIMTDAAHLFSDFIGFLISLLALWIGKKPATKYMTFGYHRAEVLGALLSVITIWMLAAIFSVLAIGRLYNKDYDIDADTMIVVACIGVVINIIMGVILHGACHLHSHGFTKHNHSPNNINVRAAIIHVLGDLLQSIGVLLAALIIKFYPNGRIADPICTLLFSLIVICTTVRIGRDSVWYLIEGSPVSSAKLATALGKLGGVKHIHSLHIWSLAPGKDAVALHLAVDQFCDRDLLLKKASSLVHSQINVVSCTLQIEAYNAELINTCRQCQGPQY
ncbi:zinc transporter 2 [Anoplophora glabripennis]|uniref:zinc transporter 2 n=1 Tax=Anoplophora glabripennis TaxID=217634 RepID=UPI00087379C2|nr:zinc transporter 2 [Anoplophora glabripennis]